MKRSPSYSDLGGSRNGVNGAARSVHNDLHFDADSTSYTLLILKEYQDKGQLIIIIFLLRYNLNLRPNNLLINGFLLQCPQQVSFRTQIKKFRGDFLDMPEPGSIPVPSPLPALPPRHDAVRMEYK